jgi:hypothetical protein
VGVEPRGGEEIADSRAGVAKIAAGHAKEKVVTNDRMRNLPCSGIAQATRRLSPAKPGPRAVQPPLSGNG